MDFEYDPVKSQENLNKHGISFEQAKKLWNDADYIIIPARTFDEKRYILIGKIKDKVYSAIFTIRKNEIRIISVRRSRKNEEKIYKS
jgi:uncharacterized protein